MDNARKTALRMLIKAEKNNSYSNILLSDSLKKSDLSAQDKRFVSAMFYGIIERRITLDAVINELCSNKSQKLGVETRNILRCGIYQLLFMDSVPDNAAVDESVKLAKGSNPSTSGFVNALLRGFIRRGKVLPKQKNKMERLSVEYSCPVWLIRKWLSEYGEKACMEMLETSLGKAPTTVRINSVFEPVEDTLKILSHEGIEYKKLAVLDNAFKLYFSGSIENTNAYKQGRLHVQDLSSQFCAAALEPCEGDVVLDLCSAPGGKAFTIAEIMNNKGNVFAYDLHENRVKLISSGAKRLGLTCIQAQTNDAKLRSDDVPMADKVLCDVPCSGLGVIRRKPEIKYKDPNEFDRLPEIQYDILKTSSEYVKQGGILIYSTCTLSRDENDNVVDRFLTEYSSFESCALGSAFGADSNKTRITFTPGKYDSDGFFVAKLKRIR